MLKRMGDMMKKKLIVRYVFLCMPFIIGIFLYSGGMINIFSSVLFFGGGYVAIKNIFDYRKINKNIRKILVNDDIKIVIDTENNEVDGNIKNEENLGVDDVFDNLDMNVNDITLNFGREIDNMDISNNNEDICNKKKYVYNESDNIPLLKNTRRHIRVRRRY